MSGEESRREEGGGADRGREERDGGADVEMFIPQKKLRALKERQNIKHYLSNGHNLVPLFCHTVADTDTHSLSCFSSSTVGFQANAASAI